MLFMETRNELSLELSEWGLPAEVLQFYHRKGITKMFQWQYECLTLGSVLNGENLIYSAPTSAGKTMVAEILVSQTVFEKQKKALIILPFVSVVREKMFYFQDMYADTGVRVEGFMGGHTPTASFQQVSVGVSTIEKANSLINRMLEENTLSNVGIVVVDELHLLGDPYRGYLLELLLTKLKYMTSVQKEIKLQIVGMSATLPNLNVLSKWLNAKLYYTDFRPVPLSERLKCGPILYNSKLDKVEDLIIPDSNAGDDSENVGHLCIETIKNGHSILIFCSTKVWCENLSAKLAAYFRKLGFSKEALNEGSPGWIIRQQLDMTKLTAVIDHLRISPVGLDKDLAKTVPFGVAFHHAGLTLDERDIIEGSFRNGSIRVLCATSTLSSGVNLPARRVIIRSPMSFGGIMDIMTYRQMIGRAGRMGVDTEGESILICKPTEKSACQHLMSSGLKPITSCLGSGKLSASMKRAILEVVASGIATTADEIAQYAGSTFLAASSRDNMRDPLTSCLEFLEEHEFIRLKEGGYAPTPLGEACLASSLPPDEGLALFRELERARRCFVLDSDLHIIYQITPYSVSEQWAKIDWLRVLNMIEELSPSMRRVADLVGVEDAFLVKVVKNAVNLSTPENRSKLSIHRRFYTSLALQDLVNEVPLPEVAQRYDCNKGMLQSLQQSAATYAGMVAEFSRRLRWGTIELIVSQFQERLQFGVQRELCELMKIPSLNGVRARALFNAGITSLPEVANADIELLEKALIAATPFQSRGQGAGEPVHEAEQRARLQAVWVTGRSGLSVREAAEIIVKESREILELELGVSAKWGTKEKDTTATPKQCLAISQKPKVMANSDRSMKPESVCTEKEVIVTDSLDEKNPSILLSNKVNHLEEEESAVSKLENLSVFIKPENVVKEKLTITKTKDIESRAESDNSNSGVLNQTEIECQGVSKILQPEDFQDKTVADISSSSKKTNLTGLHDLALDSCCDWEVTMKPEESSNGNNQPRKSLDPFEGSLNFENLSTFKPKSNDKSLLRNRFSIDVFEGSPKPCSTPISSHSRSSASVDSPDIFSQSLTFDTQLEQVCDSEEVKVFPEDIPSSPPKSPDDLGYLTDSPPVIVAEISSIKKDLLKTVGESFFVTNHCALGMKRKASPDTIAGSDESVNEEGENGKRGRKQTRMKLFHAKLKKAKKEVQVISLDGSDDEEIGATPQEEKLVSVGTSKMSALSLCRKKSFEQGNTTPAKKACTESFSRKKSFELGNSILAKKTSTNELKLNFVSETKKVVDDKIGNDGDELDGLFSDSKWNSLDIVDVCGNPDVFKSFREELKDQLVVGLAFGCRKKSFKSKPKIGANFKNTEETNIQEEENTFHNNDLVLDGVAVYWQENIVFYMKSDSPGITKEEKLLVLEDLSSKIKRVFESRDQIRVLQQCTGVSIGGTYQDPKVADWLMSTTGKEEGLRCMVKKTWPPGNIFADLVVKNFGNESVSLSTATTVPPNTRACCEAFLSYHLVRNQLPQLKQLGMLKAFMDVEMPTLQVLAEMELTGFMFDESKLKELRAELMKNVRVLESRAHSLAGRRFALSSFVQVSKVLYTELRLGKNLPQTKKTPSTSKESLEILEAETGHPLPRVILQWRKMQAILNKTLSHLLQLLPSTRVHGLCQTLTATGRISMKEPNMQNIPKDFKLALENNKIVDVRLRDIFVAPAGFLLVSADYCQIELRLLAHLANDTALIESIAGTADVFKTIAASIYGIKEDEVNDDQRQSAKQTCYGIIYGIGTKSLSVQLKVAENVAQKLMDDFKNKYTGVKEYLQSTIAECREKGYVETLNGRRRYLQAINSNDQAARKEAERQAVNTRIQGSAADLVKIAMVKISEKAKIMRHADLKLVLHLHDELIYEVRQDAILEAGNMIKQCMESAKQLSLPLTVKVRSGTSWGHLWPLQLPCS